MSTVTPQKPRSDLAKGALFCAIGGTCWGFSATCAQYLMQSKGISADWISIQRMLIGGGIIVAVGFYRRPEKMIGIWRTWPSVWRILVFGFVGMILAQYAYAVAIGYSNAGTATMLQYTGPIAVLLYVCAIERRWPHVNEAIAIVLAVSGTFFIATHGSFSSLVLSPQALFWGMLAAAGLFVNTVIAEPLIKQWGNETVTGYGLLLAGILLVVTKNTLAEDIPWDLGVILGVLGLILIGTIGAFTFFLQGLATIGSVRASMIGSMEPLSAAIFSGIFLGTVFMPMDIVGFACILATVFLLAR